MATARRSVLQQRRTDSWSSKKSNERVAVLDVTNNKLTTLNKAAAERRFSSHQAATSNRRLLTWYSTEEPHKKVALPRWANKKSVYLSGGDGKKAEYVATVHLRRLGFQYNMQRHFGTSEELYVLCYRIF